MGPAAASTRSRCDEKVKGKNQSATYLVVLIKVTVQGVYELGEDDLQVTDCALAACGTVSFVLRVMYLVGHIDLSSTQAVKKM